jgi:Arc/MetJ family transcription regulator
MLLLLLLVLEAMRALTLLKKKNGVTLMTRHRTHHTSYIIHL